jgi:hypothetical protein
MPVAVEQNLDEHILFLRYQMPVDPALDLQTAGAAIIAFSQQIQGKPFYTINDAREFPITFDILVEALSTLRQSFGSIPVRFVIIGSGKFVELAAQAITQRQYGGFEMAKVFATEEEALAYCRAERLQA